tara:strand:+ start:1863 stop:2201 length:339 start_codon:yes stop_codon:yes gene_type:complete
MDLSSLTDAINQYGFPIIAALGLAYFVYYVWKWVTTEVKPVLGKASGTLIGLIDRIRMLDNDMIRLHQKLNMVLEFKEEYEKLTGNKLDINTDDIERAVKGKKKSDLARKTK